MKKIIVAILLSFLLQFPSFSKSFEKLFDECLRDGLMVENINVNMLVLNPLTVKDLAIDTIKQGKIIAVLPAYTNISVSNADIDNWYKIQWYDSIKNEYKYGYVSFLSLEYAISPNPEKVEPNIKKLSKEIRELMRDIRILAERNTKLQQNYKLILEKNNKLLHLSFVLYNFYEQFADFTETYATLKPVLFTGYFTNAHANLFVGNYEEAVKSSNLSFEYTTMKDNDSMYQIYLRRGTAYYELQQYEKAKQDFIQCKNYAIKLGLFEDIITINEKINKISELLKK